MSQVDISQRNISLRDISQVDTSQVDTSTVQPRRAGAAMTSFSSCALRASALLVFGLAGVAGAHAQTSGAERPVSAAPVTAAQPAAVATPVVPVAPPIAAATSTPSAARGAPRVGAVPTEADRSPVVGATARHLLEAQSSGRVAAPSQPLYGTTASLSWKRYVDSFTHPIPEYLESRVGKKSSE